MGEWTLRQPPPHEHDNPKFHFGGPDDVRVGDQWTCECGTVFEVTKTKYEDDSQRDRGLSLTWEKVVDSPKSPKNGECQFIVSWVGKCKKPTTGHYCTQHAKLKCSICGNPATHDCDATVGAFVCGTPLCDGHSHHH